MKSLHDWIAFLEELERHKIFYRLSKTRKDTVMVEVAVPGERWEIEFSTYGRTDSGVIEIEKFISDGSIGGESELEVLFRKFSD